MKKHNLGRLWFPKLINLWGFISAYIIFDFRLKTSDKFFVCEILSIGDDARVHTSLFRIDIEWNEYFEINFNLLYLFHLRYEYYNESDIHGKIYNILEESVYYKNYCNSKMDFKWLKIHQHKSIGINKYIEIRFGGDLSKSELDSMLKIYGIIKFKTKQIDENHFKIYNY